MKPATTERNRDATRLLVIDPRARGMHATSITHLPEFLTSGDVLIMNDAATLPASLHAHTLHGELVEIRLLGPDDANVFSAVLFGAGDYHARTEDRAAPPELALGTWLRVDERLRVQVLERSSLSPRLVKLRFDLAGRDLWRALYAHGKPVQYAYHSQDLALWSVQTLYAARPWAAEMPSAGRPLSFATLLALKQRGVELATLTHAAGLSSTGDPAIDRALPLPERYEIPEATARAVANARARGQRVIAVGTSVVRALESSALRAGGEIVAGTAVSTLRIEPSHTLAVVDGLLTGVHSPEESHYQLLGAFVDRALLEQSSNTARELGFVSHEFGDACLILPGALRPVARAA